MDLMRSAIKSLLYDYPLDAVANYIVEGNYRETSDFYDRVRELMSWREKGFSISEISMLNNVMEEDWMTDNETGFASDRAYHPFERVFLLFQKCAVELLTLSGDSPVVKFRNLLRWRELTLLIGEDNMIIPFLARHDVLTGRERKTFQWPNILDHDDVQLNGLLNDTLSDTHFHLNAGCDVFEFNWIIIMNHPEAFDSKSSFLFNGYASRDYDPVTRHSQLNLPFVNWIRIAAYIRAKILEMQEVDHENIELILPENMFSLRSDSRMQIETVRIIEHFRRVALRTSNGIVLDYAVNNVALDGVNDTQIRDVYMAHHGERCLLYDYLRKYFGNNGESWRRFAPYVYLYLLIKNKLRREIIQTNGLRGFRNFQLYQFHKSIFFKHADDAEAIKEIAFRYAVQSAAGKSRQYHVEARVTPENIKDVRRYDYTKSIFGNMEVLKSDSGFFSLVCHFIKQPDSYNPNLSRQLRHERLRKRIRKELEIVKKEWLRNWNEANISTLTGIDAASDELVCRPEVFGPVFREARTFGISNLTYHVGEDFYDLVDGLRSIDEAIRFLGLGVGCRLGHALALGTDSERYYSHRHRYIIIPKQTLLDNLVWMMFKAMEHDITLSPKTELFIKTEFAGLTESLGYGNCSEARYWESMKLRGEDPMSFHYNPASETGRMLDIYWYSIETRRHGDAVVTKRLPESFVTDVLKIQRSMMYEIERTGLFIETNPTSNLMIGGFEKYIDLPLFKFHTIAEEGHKLPVSINTDDKGVFATSIKNEFSLVAAALKKEKDAQGNRLWHDKQIIDYLKQIASYGNISRFSV